MGKIDRNSPEGHKYSVSCVSWYPVDSGLFISGSYDNTIKVSKRKSKPTCKQDCSFQQDSNKLQVSIDICSLGFYAGRCGTQSGCSTQQPLQRHLVCRLLRCPLQQQHIP